MRFKAPQRNALWRLDYAEMRVAGEVLHMLVMLDDEAFSVNVCSACADYLDVFSLCAWRVPCCGSYVWEKAVIAQKYS